MPDAPTTSRTPLDREQNAARLLRASARHSYDPLTEIDWTAPIDPDQFALPAHRVALHGTPLWHSLTPRQQAQLSVHQFASTTAAGIWFELILMEGLVRHVYAGDLTTQHAQYALTEVADECRHSTMFARYITATGYRGVEQHGIKAEFERLGGMRRRADAGIDHERDVAQAVAQQS